MKFGNGGHNAKLAKYGRLATFSLPAGHSCPFADRCLSSADKETGKITDGLHTEFRCFAASMNAIFKHARNSAWHNFDTLRGAKTTDKMVELIENSLPINARVIRVHIGGDFFNQRYFDAWMEVAKLNPRIHFYAYTKSLLYWIKYGKENVPNNFILTASYGGTHDNLIAEHKLRYSVVVPSKYAARKLRLPIDHDDSHAIRDDGKPFALLLHGVQPKGTKAAKTIRRQRENGEYGYGHKADKIRESNK